MPEVGSQWSVTANRMMPLIAIQKSGALAPSSESTEATRSNKPPGRYAASEPMTIASARARPMVMPASLSVVGMASSTSSSAGRLLRIDSPRLPEARSPRKRPNCTIRGSLKPYLSRNSCRASTEASIGR